MTNILKLHNPTPVIERTPGFDRLLADLAHHQRFRLPRRLGLEHGLCVRVVPHVMPPIVPRGFVAVVMQHHRHDAVAVLRVEGDVMPAGVDREIFVVAAIQEGWRGAGEIGRQRAQMRLAVPAVEVLDLRLDGLVVAHPSAVALRVRGLKGYVGPVVETYAELEGFAVKAFYG